MANVKIIFWVLVVVLMATVVKYLCNNLSDKGAPDSGASYSMMESQRRGVFLYPIKIIPNRFYWEGREIRVKEAWVERRCKIKYLLVWISKKEFVDGYKICFTLEDNEDLLGGIRALLRVDKNSFSRQVCSSQTVFYLDSFEKFSLENFKPFGMALAKHWNEEVEYNILITIR